jgi:hypothetical protein
VAFLTNTGEPSYCRNIDARVWLQRVTWLTHASIKLILELEIYSMFIEPRGYGQFISPLSLARSRTPRTPVTAIPIAAILVRR